MPTLPAGVMRMRSVGTLLVAAVLKISGATLMVPRKLVPSVVTPVLPPRCQSSVTGCCLDIVALARSEQHGNGRGTQQQAFAKDTARECHSIDWSE